MTKKNTFKYALLTAFVAVCAVTVYGKKGVKIEPSYAWTISDPLGDRTETDIDTSFVNYHLHAVPTSLSNCWATTGNYGAPGYEMIYFNRGSVSDFFFQDAIAPWLHTVDSHVFYNTRIPMTLISHTTGGDKYSNQDRTMISFSGNANKRLQIGANMDYVYSKGSYEYQADKNFTWNLGGSYTGDRYELQTFFNHNAFTTKENGGIVDDRYITKPAEVQGGETKVDNKSIPTRLTSSENNIEGTHFFMNHRYKVGFYRYERDSITDTIVSKHYVPVTSFIWSLDYKNNRHRYTNKSSSEDASFYKNTFFSLGGTADTTQIMTLTNTVGIAMLEGFSKWAKFGFTVYALHQLYKHNLYAEAVAGEEPREQGLSPITGNVARKNTSNYFYVGGKLSKTRGSLLQYNASAEFGLAGGIEGEVAVDGDVSTRFKLFGDTVTVRGYGQFSNLTQNSLYESFASNHFIWDNSFDMTQRMRAGGELDLPFSGTNINAGYETINKLVYLNNENNPTQHNGTISVFSATLSQDFCFKAFNWENKVTFQTSSNQDVLPLPKLALYSNMYLKFKVAKVLHVQLGVDCNYYTKYYAPTYCPATMTFHTQDQVKCGDFLYMNAYANFRLKKARFFVLYTHANGQLFGGNNYFSLPHYPLNPRRLQVGVSVDFTN